MAIYSYRLARGQTRWMFTIDLPPAADGRRRQMNRKGFRSQDAALAAETEARWAYSRADLAADGSLAAELEHWLRERELDVQATTLSNYRDVIGYIKPHLGARQAYTLDKRPTRSRCAPRQVGHCRPDRDRDRAAPAGVAAASGGGDRSAMSIRILVLAMGQLSNGEMTIASSCLSDLDPAHFEVRFVSHANGADYLRKLGAAATGLAGCDAVQNRAAVRRLVEGFRPDLLLCADVYTLDYGSIWSGVDFAWLRTLGLPIATFDEYDWEDGDFTWDTEGGSSRVNPGLVRGCDLLIRPCPLSDPDKPPVSTRPAAEVMHCRLIPHQADPPVSLADWRAALDLRDTDTVVFTVNSSWEYVNVSAKPEMARLIEWMPRISAELFASVAKPVTVVHVGPRPWRPPSASPLDYRHFVSLPTDLYQATIQHADLFYGTNATSITLSNAVAAETPSVLLHNPRLIDFTRLGDVLPRMPQWYQEMAAEVGRCGPFQVFPWGWARFLKTVLHAGNPYLTTFAQVPAFVPARTSAALNGLLFDPDVASAQRRRQRAYFDRLDRLPPLGESLNGALRALGVRT